MAAPSGNMLSVPFRRTHNISLSSAIKQYISSKYDQHPDMFTDDLSQIDELRRHAVTVQEPHSSGIRRIQTYAAQLVWMGVKFPIDVGVDFTWYPALGYDVNTPMSQNNLRYELANVLFNMSVLYCQLAVSSNKSTADGLKSASNYFCLAAGVITHLKANVIPEMRSTAPDDMDPMTLECLEQLFLAQAQECFWQKAVKDNLKDISIAKLAAKVSDLYLQAYTFATKSNAVSSEWIHHMNAKHNHFAGAAQYRAACDCLEKRKYGEEVARLRDSLNCANNALKESRYVNKTVLADLNGLREKVQDDLKRAEKDNDMIYLVPVPPKPELKTIDRASMVSSRVPKEVAEPLQMLGDKGELGRAFFARLVPYSVHVAASIYANRRDLTINSIADEYEALSTKIHSLLQSLNLPGSLQALEKPLGLPPGIKSHAEEIRQQNGPERLARCVLDVDKLKQADRAVYNEGVSLLRSELGEDEAARRKYGTDRWSRPQSQAAAKRLYEQVTELDGYLNTAEGSDATVRNKLRESEPLIGLLNSSDRAIEDFVPSSRQATITPQVQREVAQLRTALNDATRMESRRRKRVESLRTKAQADDVTPELLRETARLEREMPMQPVSAVQFEDFFDQRLTRYEDDSNAIEDESREQDAILQRITEANTSFANARRGDNSTRSREQALQKLENAYFAYKEIIQNLDVGRKFYNDLAGIVGKFRDDCSTFAYSRRTEAARIESDIANALPLANLNLGSGTQNNGFQHQRQPPQGQRYDSARSSTLQQQRAEQPTPLPAPVPIKSAPVANMTAANGLNAQAGPITGTWDPDMGIKFASGTTPLAESQNTAAKNKDTRWDPTRGLRFGSNG